MFDNMVQDVFCFCSWVENDISSNIIDFVNKNRYCSIPKEEVDDFLMSNHIDYFSLPTYLKEMIDILDVY